MTGTLSTACVRVLAMFCRRVSPVFLDTTEHTRGLASVQQEYELRSSIDVKEKL